MNIECTDIYRVIIKVKYEQYIKVLNSYREGVTRRIMTDPNLFCDEYYAFRADCSTQEERDEVIQWVKGVLGNR